MANELEVAFRSGFEKEAASQYKALKELVESGKPLFHGTTKSKADEILESGLDVSKSFKSSERLEPAAKRLQKVKSGERDFFPFHRGKLESNYISLTPSREAAESYARSRSSTEALGLSRGRTNVNPLEAAYETNVGRSLLSSIPGMPSAAGKGAILKIHPTEEMIENMRAVGRGSSYPEGFTGDIDDLLQSHEILSTGSIPSKNIELDSVI